MWNLLKSELLKLRRCQILLVGLVALALCPLVQYGSQLIIDAEYRNPSYNFQMLFENVVWGNTQIFLPISLVMIGGWLIDREFTQDTLKNIMVIPVSMPSLLGAKLLLTGILASVFAVSAALILVGFDMRAYAGTTAASNPLLSIIGIGIMVLWAVLLMMSSNKKEMKFRKQKNPPGKGKRSAGRKRR